MTLIATIADGGTVCLENRYNSYAVIQTEPPSVAGKSLKAKTSPTNALQPIETLLQY